MNIEEALIETLKTTTRDTVIDNDQKSYLERWRIFSFHFKKLFYLFLKKNDPSFILLFIFYDLSL